MLDIVLAHGGTGSEAEVGALVERAISGSEGAWTSSRVDSLQRAA